MRNRMYTECFLVKPDPSDALVTLTDSLSSKSSRLRVFTNKSSTGELSIPPGTVIPPDLPKMFLDLLIPVKGIHQWDVNVQKHKYNEGGIDINGRTSTHVLRTLHFLKNKKLPYICSICDEELATWNSLVTHNKSHPQPACLSCGSLLASVAKLSAHTLLCTRSSLTDSVVITSKYGRSRPVKSYLANLKV